ncbi:DUF1801 domain-containing protein [Pedobacter sp. MC2016-05]|uniref:DUF1801 domain-containing protein n=1 Tax=Pedobacter sp. MC2016-05 TaxID=2994474 RepID=UPI00224629CC|nr:DUF1801 domain-containing protein [Pedobacter sp. MC2016-05]MCX2475797.1 DUF1801 domain-containing protein [Pedobacter sp. MC2016-05]
MARKKKLAEIKTKPTQASVDEFINSIDDEQKREDSFTILQMMKDASGEEPVLWSSSIIGFGNKQVTSTATGRTVNWLRIGFSSRKANLSLYLTVNYEKHLDLMKELGKHKAGAGCLYISKLDDINLDVLRKIIKLSLHNLV